MKQWILLMVVALAVLSGCSANRKLQAAGILRQCKAEIVAVELDSYTLDSTLFPALHGKSTEALPNANVLPLVQKLLNGELERPLGVATLLVRLRVQSQSPDTLWIDSLEGVLSLDTLMSSPVNLAKPVLLHKGANEVVVAARLDLSPRLFALARAREYGIRGVAHAALKSDGKRVELEFDEKRPLPKDQVDQLLKTARQSLIEQVVSSWAKSIM